ncbi:acyl transferase domain-containing protein [Tahibacter aquaticus]|uniref:Acyl transferase domain-containing protein n=1 Tax=Tahibacter aquaticus TaxID=520092 RepID=A0A4R6YU81_9GAMM|nr:beta-ketoacyl synthase N-terminal-like domain-containing protein [Tahibacter aquaticus]TDR42094.1 acyl transferase domain-containing protein [Tahibacter aquaticus]
MIEPVFEPVAIVGRACVLPGALNPAALWDAVVNGRDLVTRVPADRWRLAPGHALCAPEAPQPDRTWSDRGGYVEGFASIWNPQGFAVAAAELEGLDPLVHWTLHCAREALRETRSAGRVGAIFGNLGFPTAHMAAFCEQVWTGEGDVDPRNRFMSGGTAAMLQRALALQAGSFCLDAACASSLYAIKLACDALHDGRADVMLAGAVQRADDLFLHVGFCALGALSKSGRSRPFHRDADGLVPAEGAAFLALKRLADARRDGDTIHGLIRGIGLSNDGRGKGFLAPSEEGQRRAISAAYAASGIEPTQVSLLECHATGTPVGDATELRSSAGVFAQAHNLPIGSLKSNLGHLITVAGAAGLIKLLEAMHNRVRPPTVQCGDPTPALQQTPFRVLHDAEPWTSDGPRVAAISAFGFGGNNAHLIVSEDDNRIGGERVAAVARPVAIVGIGAKVADAPDRAAFARALFADHAARDGATDSDAGAARDGRMDYVELDMEGLRFPPRDLEQALPQQLALLAAAREALAETTPLPRERSAALVGLEPDPEVARHGARWRLTNGRDDDWAARARATLVPALEAAAVLGSMPNIPANRLNSQFDLGGPSFTLQAGAASGTHALRIAARALACGELDAAIVGAVDFGCEAVHRAASREGEVPGDAAVALVLKRLEDAQRDGDRVYALIDNDTLVDDAFVSATTVATDAPPSRLRSLLQARFGYAQAAFGLLETAAAALALHHRRDFDGAPWLSAGPRRAANLVEASAHPRRAEHAVARLHCFAGADKAAVIAALKQDRRGLDGPARCVLVATDASLATVRARAIAHLETGAPAGRGVFFRAQPIVGEIAFAFAGAGASYRGMGRDLLLHLPQLHEPLRARSQRLATALDGSFAAGDAAPSVFEQLCGSSALSQLHLALSEGLLGLQADAWLGYSSGETNALIAAGVWNDPDALMSDMESSGLLERELAGRFDVLARAWGEPAAWECWTVAASLDEVRRALAGLDRVHIAIVNDDASCLVAGAAVSCARVVERLGAARCLQLDYSLVVHVPELRGVERAWLAVHRRATSAPRHGRVYSTASGRPYAPDSEACAQAILAQAVDTIDIRALVDNAWNDGVRVFIEHGPGGTFGRAIRHVLGAREALVVSLDRQGDGIETVLGATAALLAAGVAVDHQALEAALAPVPRIEPKRPRRFDAHPPPVNLPPREQPLQTMAPAPQLPAILERLIVAPPILEQTMREPAAVALPVAAPARVASPLVRATHPALEGIRAELARLAAAQQAFTEAQTRAHAQFLAVQAKATDVLLRAGRQGASPLAIPLPSVPPEAKRHPRSGPEERDTAWPIKRETRDAAVPTPGQNRSAPAFAAVTERAVRFTRDDLLVHADGNISAIFGAPFAAQDGFTRQVRMPRPPLLLADRVTALHAEPMSMGKGSITTQTDIGAEPWYLHQGRMPGGVMVEAGQADLMLISWLGVDALNQSERVYRLLGCELTYHGELPRTGETITFDIHLDGHAAQGDVRLMFFHYDCMNGSRKQLTVRNGQAGFFTDAELAGSAGCLWTPEGQEIVANPRLDPPRATSTQTRFDRAALEAFANGDTPACFGTGFELARTHTRSPRIQSGDMLLLDRVSVCEPRGGPWGRGYLRAELDIDPSRWFFDGHFKNDPCMPGTLMLEGCLQALAFHLAACGYTLEHDGARFEPVPELAYKLQCRGQVIPSAKLLVTEVFVEEIAAGPVPTIWADLLCTVDGLKAFHARRLALRLVPDFPAADSEGLLASALGRPSRAFGAMYERFDGTLRAPRLPAPPYLCMSRIAGVDGTPGERRAGARVVAEYDVPHDAWYLDAAGVAPFAVLQEAALQPCGWLSSWAGCALASEEALRFRNLDGRGTQHSELRGGETLSTEATLTSVSASGGMIIVAFDVRCTAGAREVYTLKTVFGFFPIAALAAQAGLPRSALHEALLGREPNAGRTLDEPSMLRMIDRVDGVWPEAIRACKRVDAGEWFFKAHFFQDPVQPGSLGVQAMLQTLEQWLRATRGTLSGVVAPLLGREHTWKYRGQVLPHHRDVTITLQVTETGPDYAVADASLWVDGERIYEASGIGLRLRDQG